MKDRPSTSSDLAAQLLLRALDAEGLVVVAYYWRRLRQTRARWVLVVSLAEFGPELEPGLSRLLDVCEKREEELVGLGPMDLWALEPHDPEPTHYTRAVAESATPWPRSFRGSVSLPQALLYRLPTP